jgi:hypothetical protein
MAGVIMQDERIKKIFEWLVDNDLKKEAFELHSVLDDADRLREYRRSIRRSRSRRARLNSMHNLIKGLES